MGERASLTTFFRPFLSRLDSAVKTVNTSVSYSHSQVSRASISHSLCECVEIYAFKFVILWDRPFFSALVLVSPAEATTGNTSAVRRLRIHHPVSPQPPRVFRIFLTPLYWTTFYHYLGAWNRLSLQQLRSLNFLQRSQPDLMKTRLNSSLVTEALKSNHSLQQASRLCEM